jgi:hypothetical protein
MLYIPRGLYGFQQSERASTSIRVMASRMLFEKENQIRVIDKHGLDTVIQLNYEE